MNGVLIPQRVFVGDTVQFFFQLSEKEYVNLTGLGFTSNIPIPLKDITQNDVMTINEIRIVTRETGHYLAITFVPWETGTIEFPSFAFLQLHRKLPAISVSSLLETGQRVSLQPPKLPLLPPGTDFLLYGAVALGAGLLAALGTGVWLLLLKLRKQTLGTAKKRIDALRKQLKRLYKGARKIQKHLSLSDTSNMTYDIQNWYAAIDRCLRQYIRALYMSNTLAVPAKDGAYFLSATYTELMAILRDLFAQKPEIADLFCIFYVMLERQRFASTSAELILNYTAVSQDMLKQLPHIVEKAEDEYTLRDHEAMMVIDKNHPLTM